MIKPQPDRGIRAYLGLGANLGRPEVQIQQALQRLSEHPGIELLAVSSFYRSQPMELPGLPEQPDYCNAAAIIETALAPAQLLPVLQALETAAGRRRDGPRWGPRPLDLDLLHVEGWQLDDADLQLPHPGLAVRNFVLVPLAEIAAEVQIPGLGAVAALAEAAGRQGLELWNPEHRRCANLLQCTPAIHDLRPTVDN